jgi:hypothetical protein
MKKHYRKENDCLNCGTILQGKFCHNCGQENLQMKESFGHMMNHAISDYFHFDDQFFHTMRPLFLKPGFLTNQYMSGHRAAYLHPVKMYIFISLVYFVLVFKTGQNIVKVNNNDPKVSQKEAQRVIDSISKDPEIPAYLKKSLIAEVKKKDPAVTDSNARVAHLNKNNQKQNLGFLTPTTNDSTYKAYIAAQAKLPENKRDGFIESFYNKKAFALNAEYGDRTRDELVEQFEHNIPKMMFLLLPLCALILMIAFRDRTKYYVEYLIYTFHLHSFIFLFLAIIIIMKWLIPVAQIDKLLDFFASITVIYYIYKSLRVVYSRSRFRTITKMIGAFTLYFFSFMVCLLLAFIITALIA